jgi:hypothetical protein
MLLSNFVHSRFAGGYGLKTMGYAGVRDPAVTVPTPSENSVHRSRTPTYLNATITGVSFEVSNLATLIRRLIIAPRSIESHERYNSRSLRTTVRALLQTSIRALTHFRCACDASQTHDICLIVGSIGIPIAGPPYLESAALFIAVAVIVL